MKMFNVIRSKVQGTALGAGIIANIAHSPGVALAFRAVKDQLDEIDREWPVTVTILCDGQPVAEFTDASLARMALVMFQSNEAANGNTAHQWTMEGDQ